MPHSCQARDQASPITLYGLDGLRCCKPRAHRAAYWGEETGKPGPDGTKCPSLLHQSSIAWAGLHMAFGADPESSRCAAAARSSLRGSALVRPDWAEVCY